MYIYTPYMTIYLVASLPKKVHVWLWPTLQKCFSYYAWSDRHLFCLKRIFTNSCLDGRKTTTLTEQL